jgi:SAM-dependent methyltransferase
MINNEKRKHWENIYQKDSNQLTWFQGKPAASLGLIQKISLPKDAAILDIGGGASTLVDHLLEDHYQNITVFDLSSSALDQAQRRLGKNGDIVEWRVGNILDVDIEKKYQLCHDRAVFHFLTSETDRAKYLDSLNHLCSEHGHFIIATFAEDGPFKCSGLDICRYAKDDLVDYFSKDFELIEFLKEDHVSPNNKVQKFNYWLFQKKY